MKGKMEEKMEEVKEKIEGIDEEIERVDEKVKGMDGDRNKRKNARVGCEN